MAVNYIQFSAASATDGVTVAADTMTVGTATGVEVQLIKFGYGTEEVYNQVATGQGLPVYDEDLQNAISTANTSTSDLDAAGTFVGTAEDVSAFSAVTIHIHSIEASAASGMIFEFSDNGTVWHDRYKFSYSTTTATSDARRFQFPVTAQYFRVNYTNGAASATEFSVQTIKHRRNVGASIHRLANYTSPDRSAQVVKAALIAQINGSGDFMPIQSTAGGILKIGGSVEVDTWSATDLNVNLAQTATVDIAAGATMSVDVVNTATVSLATDKVIDVSAATTATQPVEIQNTATVVVTSGNITASQSTHDSLNANANLQIGDADVAAGNPVWVRIAASGTATQAVDVSAWSATDLNVNLALTATVAFATAATMAVEVTNTSIAITQATESIVTQDTATDMNVTAFQTTATGLNAITSRYPRSGRVFVHDTTTGTDSSTLVTATADAYKDLIGILITNGSTSALTVIVKDCSTSTAFHHEIAGDGGGFSFVPIEPLPQSQQATNWTWETDADTSGATPVGVTAMFGIAT